MRRLGLIGPVRRPKAEKQPRAGSWRDRVALQLALVTAVCLGLVFFLFKDTKFLMPGPLASAHGGIEKCSVCHTKSGSGNVSWTHGLAAGDPRADSKACLTCHKMPDTAFNAHSASAEVLEKSTGRLGKIAALTPQPKSARAQSLAFPAQDVMARGLECATCHQEHQGANFKLNKISNEQCRSCHVVKFDSFNGDHPKFDNYPFKRRTRIVYDHAGHFNKHYPEVTKKDPSKRIPATCATCHNTDDDKRIMAVAPFEKTCSGCHLDQINGKERVSGPKGVAFLSLPGLDLQTLKTKNAVIGEWPDASDAALTPFMKVMISRNEQGRALIKTVDSLNLQDLSDASDDQIKAVSSLVWEIKAIVHGLISGKASDALGDLNIGGGAKLSAELVADLTASIPRDVLISAQQQWLPNLATEITNGPIVSDEKTIIGEQEQNDSNPATTESKLGESDTQDGLSGSDESEADPSVSPEAADRKATSIAKRDPPACLVRLLGQCLISNEKNDAEAAAKPAEAAGLTDSPNPKPGNDPKPGSDEGTSSSRKLLAPMRAGLSDAGPAARPDAAAGKAGSANAKADGGEKALTSEAKPPVKAADQSDDLLAPTEEELREIKAHTKADGKAAQPQSESAPANSPAASNTSTEKPQTTAQPVISIDSGVDPESWAEYGGWYRQDYAIFYRPTGHKDKFIYAWLFLTGPQAPKSDTSPAAAVFDLLTNKDAQGSCTKCHSIDDIPGKGRVVNFSPPSLESKRGHFTSFIHEPHFGIMDNRGCLTCHAIEKGPYLKSYEQGNPESFKSNFGAVKKELCQTCHKSSKARADCLTCHEYHVNGVMTPIMTTKNPTQ